MNRFGTISSVCGPTSKPTGGFCCGRARANTLSVISGKTAAAATSQVKHIRVSFIVLYSSLEMAICILLRFGSDELPVFNDIISIICLQSFHSRIITGKQLSAQVPLYA